MSDEIIRPGKCEICDTSLYEGVNHKVCFECGFVQCEYCMDETEWFQIKVGNSYEEFCNECCEESNAYLLRGEDMKKPMTIQEAKSNLKQLAGGKYHLISIGEHADGELVCSVYIDGERYYCGNTWEAAFKDRETKI